MHVCIDFCTLNANMHVDWYPILHIDNMLNWLHGVCMFSKIDLQVIIRSKSEKVTSTMPCSRVIGDCMNIL